LIMNHVNDETGMVAVIIPAAGEGRRFGAGQPKQLTDLCGWPILAHTLSRFDQTVAVDRVVLTVPYGRIKQVREEVVEPYGFTKPCVVIEGGKTRQESVYEGFLALEEDVDLIVVHDGVRPLVRPSTIESVIAEAREHGAAIAAVPVRDTLKRVRDGVIQTTLPRDEIWQAQTPQAFLRPILAEAMAAAWREGFQGTDEAALVERTGHPVRVYHGTADNIKITSPEDLVLAEALIGATAEGNHH
jgi:2-C-methyl-D-erythritol 4-phosphate cytidylyltransferase